MLLMGKKGCSQPPSNHFQKTILVHSKSLGVLVASYSKFCNSSGCNNANSSEVLLKGLPQQGGTLGRPEAGGPKGAAARS